VVHPVKEVIVLRGFFLRRKMRGFVEKLRVQSTHIHSVLAVAKYTQSGRIILTSHSTFQGHGGNEKGLI
jgi:hypothetical protein